MFPIHTNPKEYGRWKRAGGKDSRTIAEISLAEIGNAMVHLAEVSMGITRAEILAETARILGSQRNSPAITKRVEDALVMVEKTGRLHHQDGYLRASS